MPTLHSKYGRLPFSPLYQFVLRKPLLNDGTQYHPGDVIDRTDGFDDRRLMQLYENWFTQVRTDDDGVPMSIATVQAPDKPARAAVSNPAPQPEAGEAATGSTTRYARHEGFGKWFIYEGDKQVAGPYAKAEALAIAPKAA